MFTLLKFLSNISLFYFQVIFLFCWFLINIYWFFRQKNIFVLTFLIFFNLIFITLLGLKIWTNDIEVMVINTQDLPVFAGPDKEFHIINFLKLNDEILILEKRNLWYKIKTSELSGWVFYKDLNVT